MADLPHPVTGQPFPSPVPPGTGWPDDPATPAHPGRAATPTTCAASRPTPTSPGALRGRVSVCRACDRAGRLARGRGAGQARVVRRRALLGPPDRRLGVDDAPRVLVARVWRPAANGGNRTGRIFTGDRSGDWLFAVAAPGRARQRSRPRVHAGDGLRLVRHPDGGRGPLRTTGQQADARPSGTPAPRGCEREVALVEASVRAVVCLGSFGWDAALRTLPGDRVRRTRPQPRFGHAAEAVLTAPHRPDRAAARQLPPRRSRTPSPASSPSRCWTPCSAARRPGSGRLTAPPPYPNGRGRGLKTFSLGSNPGGGTQPGPAVEGGAPCTSIFSGRPGSPRGPTGTRCRPPAMPARRSDPGGRITQVSKQRCSPPPQPRRDVDRAA